MPASMICEVRPGGHYGYAGPRKAKLPTCRSSICRGGWTTRAAAQVEVTSDRWGPLKGQLIHFSFGAGTHFLVLREQVDGQPQGAVVPLPGDFLSGVHRGPIQPQGRSALRHGDGGLGNVHPAGRLLPAGALHR